MIKLKSWNQLKVSQYLDLLSLNTEDYKDTLDYRCDCVSIVYDVDIEVIEQLGIDELFELENLPFLKNPPKTFKNVLGGYKIIDFYKIKLGEFIDVEHYINDIQNAPIVLAILYRQFKLDEWQNEILEPYEYDIKLRSEVFNDTLMSDTFGVVQSYVEFHNHIMESYKDIFYVDESEDDEEVTPEIQKEIEEEKKLLKYSWERLVFSLANEDITKMQEVLKLPAILVFNHLAMKKGGVI
jgi:hypothetical protein